MNQPNTQLPNKKSSYSLSVVMIVKNEERNLATSLPKLAGLADEIIILDSGSTDNSQQIARQFGAKWYVNTDWQGFGKQRQLAQSYAKGDWILALDADEEIMDDLKSSILSIKHTKPGTIIYGIKLIDCVFGHEIDSRYWALKSHHRLYPSTYTFDDNLVHESVVLNGASVRALFGFARHHTATTPQFWIQKRLNYAAAWAKDRHLKHKKTSFLGILGHAYWAFIKQYFIDGRFLKGRYGFIYALLFTHYTFNKYFMLWQLNNDT